MIIKDPDLLRADCIDVLSDEVESLRNELERELKFSYEMGRPGIGLAAPQIGINKNMAIVRIVSDSGQKYNVDLVNCRIAEAYDKAEFPREGCLSFPGVCKNTMRYQEIYVVENLVEPYEFIATGLFGACIQHELDHLKGVLLVDM